MQNALDLLTPTNDRVLEKRKTAWVQLAGHAGTYCLTLILWPEKFCRKLDVQNRTVENSLHRRSGIHNIEDAHFKS